MVDSVLHNAFHPLLRDVRVLALAGARWASFACVYVLNGAIAKGEGYDGFGFSGQPGGCRIIHGSFHSSRWKWLVNAKRQLFPVENWRRQKHLTGVNVNLANTFQSESVWAPR
jgi:hypothetical protein